jgi:hypothetical protein
MSEKFPNSTGAKVENIYNRERFERENAHEIVEKMCTDFSSHYSENDYIEKESVPVSSKIDPSVRFIGSHISVFKPELLDGTIPESGEFMKQDCLRTKNVGGLFNDEYVPGWGSSFKSLGALVQADSLDKATEHQLSFFTEKLGLKLEDLKMRISSTDTDLMESCLKYLPEESLEIDTRDAKYYQHIIGAEGVRGRNYNMALRNPNGEGFSDVGNIILLENDDGVMGVETAIGSSVVLKQLYDIDHVNDCYPLIGLENVDPRFRRKFEDSLIVSTQLLREGLQPRGSDNRERILRSYLRSILYFSEKTSVTLDQIGDLIREFEDKQYPETSNDTASIIINHLSEYESLLRSGQINGKEDEIIASVLK